MLVLALALVLVLVPRVGPRCRVELCQKIPTLALDLPLSLDLTPVHLLVLVLALILSLVLALILSLVLALVQHQTPPLVLALGQILYPALALAPTLTLALSPWQRYGGCWWRNWKATVEQHIS